MESRRSQFITMAIQRHTSSTIVCVYLWQIFPRSSRASTEYAFSLTAAALLSLLPDFGARF
jgi:hypothetical protein